MIYLHMSELMSDGEGGREAVILYYSAATPRAGQLVIQLLLE